LQIFIRARAWQQENVIDAVACRKRSAKNPRAEPWIGRPFSAPLLQPLLQDEENCGAGEGCHVAGYVPGRLRVTLAEPNSFLNIA